MPFNHDATRPHQATLPPLFQLAASRHSCIFSIAALPPNERRTVAIICVDPTQSNEPGTVRGLCWHNLPRERKGVWATPPPPPVPARKTQCSGATFRRAIFSAKEVPGAQDLSPRAQTHLPFGCSVVGVMWKPKASLRLQKKFFHLSVCTWFLISGMSEPATGPVVYAQAYRCACVGSNPTNHPPKFFLHFLSLCSDLHPKLSLV